MNIWGQVFDFEKKTKKETVKETGTDLFNRLLCSRVDDLGVYQK